MLPIADISNVVSRPRRLGLACLALVAVALAAGMASAPRAAAAPEPPSTSTVLLPQYGTFACQMIDEGEGASAWVYCWDGGNESRHVRLDPDGQVSLTATAPKPTGLGGPGNPPGAWRLVGRFRCEVQRHGVECVVIASGKGFRIQGKNIAEIQAQPGVVEPAPVLGQNAILDSASGLVRIREPGTRYLTILNGLTRVPTGTVVDTTQGTIQLTSAADSAGGVQTGLFHGGLFRIAQPSTRSLGAGQPEGLTVLTLVGRPPTGCGGTRARGRGARASVAGIRARRGRAGSRRLWGDAHGDFETGGRYASATVSGTKWLTRDTCAGTLVAVARGAVSVEDRVSHRTVTVTAGHRYLANAPGTRHSSSPSAVSHALIWKALDGAVLCGVAAHVVGQPARDLLCSARPVPPPKRGSDSEGDPGFVFLRASGSPRLARLSQYSFLPPDGWKPGHQATLEAGRKWTFGSLGVKCAIAATSVRCANRSGHGFTVTASSYDGF